MRNTILQLSAALSFMAGLLLAILTGWQTFMTRGLDVEAQLLGFVLALGYLVAGLTSWALLTAVADIAEKLGVRT